MRYLLMIGIFYHLPEGGCCLFEQISFYSNFNFNEKLKNITNLIQLLQLWKEIKQPSVLSETPMILEAHQFDQSVKSNSADLEESIELWTLLNSNN